MSTGNFHEVSAAVSRRAAALRADGLELHAHALEYMMSSLSSRDALGDWSVLEALARECDRATPLQVGDRVRFAGTDHLGTVDFVSEDNATVGTAWDDGRVSLNAADRLERTA